MRRKEGNGREQAVNPHKLKRKLGDFTCTVCGGKKHNKQTCPVAKKQRHDEFMVQQKPPNTTVLPQTGPTTSAIGPTPTAGGSVVQGSSLPDEIDLSQSQPPPLNPSPPKTHNMVLRPKLNIRGKKGATAQESSPQKIPPPTSPKLNAEDSNKARQFMPTPGFRPQGP
ncbi:hypothetical protein SESBI_06914 [Sesbania bispinosa]|nr:hypothetical protein SESBI_06914 [Sesbania bispinosa]